MYTLVGVVLALCVSYGACQTTIDLRPYNETAKAMFVSADLDHDQTFTIDELRYSYNAYDADGDGVVTRTEYTTFTAHLNPEMFDLTHALYDNFDADKDDVLTLFDFNALFKLMDNNENGRVSQKEYVHWWTVTLESLDHLHHPLDYNPICKQGFK
ncbi:uncharacterized protein LOC124149006 [Haliotis rufescens]|uniref:uncharacterized protein LOC124149006 n=1 Tax=Haliotis rufescens TaxID=6454 RepID=UPI00201EA0DC|nr:uncharacterized protein LOC124149006 [Haliotis rufescens]